MRRVFTIVLAVFIGLMAVQAQQKKSSTVQKADKYFENLEYLKAIEYYKKAEKAGKADAYVYRKLADAYYNVFDPRNAVRYYKKILKTTDDPEVYFRYAQMLKSLGKYRQSEPWMKKFAEMRPSDHRAIAYKQNPGYLVKILDRKRKKFIVHEDANLNSEFADYGAQVKGNKIYFVTHRVLNKKHMWDGQPYGEIFEADYVGGLASNLHQVRGAVNTKYHEGAFSFSPDGKIIYFTRNNFKEKNLKVDSAGITHLKIYMAKWDGTRWVNDKELPFNSDYFDTAHPAVTEDGKRMYFASNRPGTFGESDIFYVDINDDGTFGEPVHLGPEINTEGREDYPYFVDNTLYFASDGHLGLGGRDIFASKLVDGKFSRARNLGVPVNSASDDITFVFYPKEKKGFMASNRGAKKYGDYDIFNVQAIKPVFDVLVEAKVIDAKTKRPIPNATVVLTDDSGNPMATKVANADGIVDFLIEGGKDVVLEARAEEHENAKVTIPATYDEAVDVTIELNPIEEIITAEKLNIKPIYFDFDKWNIRRDAAFELDNVVEAMKKYPQMKIHVVSHTDCRGSIPYNQRLSEKRAKATVQYIISKGIDASRLTWEGKGETEPKIECNPCNSCTEEQHQINRRSDFFIITDKKQESETE